MEDFILGAFLVVVMVGLLMGTLFLSRATCYAKYSDYEPQWGILSKCQVVWEGRLTPVENIGLREIN